MKYRFLILAILMLFFWPRVDTVRGSATTLPGASQPAPNCTIRGTSRNDVLRGTVRDDVICGLAGNDTISGGGGNDIIQGKDGDDIIDGDKWLNVRIEVKVNNVVIGTTDGLTKQIFDPVTGAVLFGGKTLEQALFAREVKAADLNVVREIIDGDAEAVSEVNDVWTFARDVRSRDPNWKLIATEAEQ